jgi:hypothetical protein
MSNKPKNPNTSGDRTSTRYDLPTTNNKGQPPSSPVKGRVSPADLVKQTDAKKGK